MKTKTITLAKIFGVSFYTQYREFSKLNIKNRLLLDYDDLKKYYHHLVNDGSNINYVKSLKMLEEFPFLKEGH